MACDNFLLMIRRHLPN